MIILILLFITVPLALCQFIAPERFFEEVDDVPFVELDETEYAISE